MKGRKDLRVTKTFRIWTLQSLERGSGSYVIAHIYVGWRTEGTVTPPLSITTQLSVSFIDILHL